MKAKAALGCVAALSLLLAGCGGSDTNTADNSGTSTQNTSGTTATNSGTAAADATTSCTSVTESDIAALFERWNDDLVSGDPAKVAENYAAESILLPTVSDKVRFTSEEKQDYFTHWLEKKPSGVVNKRWIELDCNRAVDAGIYTFTYGDGTKVPARYTFVYGVENGEWKILTHHSSAMPQEGADTDLPAATNTTGSPEAETDPETCSNSGEQSLTARFNAWTGDIDSGNAINVADAYADNSVVLPSNSNELLLTEEEQERYFAQFLAGGPKVTVDQRWSDVDCTTATDSGLYTFTYPDGTVTQARFTFTYRWDDDEWKILSHHSSVMPEGGANKDHASHGH